MTPNEALRELRKLLVKLCDDTNSILLHAHDANIDIARLNFQRPPEIVWLDVLLEAIKIDVLGKIVRSVGKEYLNHAETLEQAYLTYQNARSEYPNSKPVGNNDLKKDGDRLLTTKVDHPESSPAHALLSIQHAYRDINLSVFDVTLPENDRNLSTYFVEPALLSALLNYESTLLSAPHGYGKSTLAFIARQRMQSEWMNVSLKHSEDDNENIMVTLLRQVTQSMWSYIEVNPASLARLRSSAATRYFLEYYSGYDINSLLTQLAENCEEHSQIVQAFRAIQSPKLFNLSDGSTQHIIKLCDCVRQLGMKGIVFWIDLSDDLKYLSPSYLDMLQGFFDSLDLTSQSTLHVKCLAPPSVCQRLSSLRGLQTLRVPLLKLEWSRDQLIHLVDQRLRLASNQRIRALTQLIEPEECKAFLDYFSDASNPLEWLTLVRLIIEKVKITGEFPLLELAWQSVQRAYCAKCVKIQMDEQGRFWRGKQLLTELTPKKNLDVYRLVKYLYEHRRECTTRELRHALAVNESKLNELINQAREQHLEPFPLTDQDFEGTWIYLTDARDGYILNHVYQLL